eukprot:gene8092-8749_t
MSGIWTKAFQQARKQNDYDDEYDPHTGKRKFIESKSEKRIEKKLVEEEENDDEENEYGAFKQPASLANFIGGSKKVLPANTVPSLIASEQTKKEKKSEDIPNGKEEGEEEKQHLEELDYDLLPTFRRKKRRRLNITLAYQL